MWFYPEIFYPNRPRDFVGCADISSCPVYYSSFETISAFI